jgi:hypothetical protein
MNIARIGMMMSLQKLNSESKKAPLERQRTVAVMNDADGICKDYF